MTRDMTMAQRMRRIDSLLAEWFAYLRFYSETPKWRIRKRRRLWQHILAIEAKLDA